MWKTTHLCSHIAINKLYSVKMVNIKKLFNLVWVYSFLMQTTFVSHWGIISFLIRRLQQRRLGFAYQGEGGSLVRIVKESKIYNQVFWTLSHPYSLILKLLWVLPHSKPSKCTLLKPQILLILAVLQLHPLLPWSPLQLHTSFFDPLLQ